MELREGLLAAGAALVVAGFVWRWASNRARLRSLAADLDNEDPAARVAAVRALCTLGLDHSASTLLATVDGEPDASVLDELAIAVVLRQWEPGGDEAVDQLREWSAARLVERGTAVGRLGPSTTRLADMGGPRPQWSGEPGPTGDRSLDAVLAELRALCARLGVDHAELSIDGHRLHLERAPSATHAQVPADERDRLATAAGTSGELGGYEISVDAPRGVGGPDRRPPALPAREPTISEGSR